MTRKKLFFVALATVAGAGVLVGPYLMGNTVRAAGEDTRAQDERVYTVHTTPAAHHVFDQALSAQGSIASKRYAAVPSRVSGALDAVFVDEGDPVEQGVTPLFQVDRANLERLHLMAQQDLAVARCAVREAEANLDRVDADLHKARIDFERFTRLVEKKAVTPEAVEQQESRYRQTQALRKHAAAMVDLTKEQLAQAEIAVGLAEKNLSDSVVLAPLDGVVTARLLEPGEMAEPGKVVLRVEDLRTLEASVHLPSQFFGQIRAGETEISLAVAGQDAGRFPVSYKSPTIDPMLRTFEVRCLLESYPEFVAPGAMAEAVVTLEKHEGLGVPADAVLPRGGESVVFVVVDDVAHAHTVSTGGPSNGWIEVLSGEVNEGDAVVSAGQHMLDDGAKVMVQQEQH